MLQVEVIQAPTKERLINRVTTEFKLQYGNEPDIVTLTPGRINIIGEHTDYNDGLAMPAAIDRWICATAYRSGNELSTIYSLNYKEGAVMSAHAMENYQEVWKRLAAASIRLIKTEFDIDEGVNMVLGGNIPIGCGLSSSSALVISITQTVCQLLSIQMEDRELAAFCQKIENRALGTAGGLLDQYGIILSKKEHSLMIDFQDNSIEYLPLLLNGRSWLVVNSQIQRELSESAYVQRVNECKDGLEILKGKFDITGFRDIDRKMLLELKMNHEVFYKRLCHVVDENDRVRDMKDQLVRGVADRVGALLRESHESLRSLYDVSCEEIDYIIELSENFDGWYGGRILGGGFGGCSIHLVADHAVEDYCSNMTVNYIKRYDIIPELLNVSFSGGLQSC